MSDTPRVDSYVYKFPGCQREPRLIDFARQLEREIAEVRADLRLAKNIIETHVERVAERDKLIEQMKDALEYDRIALLIMVEQKLINPDGITLKTNKAALSAAERIKK